MAFRKKTVRDINLKNKTVLVRVDYNVLDNEGKVTEDYRIKQSLPTLKYLLRQNCKIILASHAGRPDGKRTPGLSLKHLVKKLERLVNQTVYFSDEAVGKKAEATAAKLKPKEILLLENLRFYPEEEKNDPKFASSLSSLAEVFVQDAFGNAHRRHASMVAITKYLPSVAGLLLEKEVDTITEALEHPKRPLVAIIGGAKVSDKIDLIDNLVKKVDQLVIGGAMANTFFLDEHFKHPIGKSVHEEHMKPEIARVIKAIKAKLNISGNELIEALKNFLILPDADVAVAKEVSEAAPRREIPIDQVSSDDYIVDFGARSTHKVARLVHQASTVIWNGPLGVTEVKRFAKGSIEIARAIANTRAESLLAGGDTAAFLESQGLIGKFDWVSTGGGAALELMAGKKLPAVESLTNK